MSSDREANKRAVTAFYDLMFNQCRPLLRVIPEKSANPNTMF